MERIEERMTSSEIMKKVEPLDIMALEIPDIVEHVTKFLSNSDLLTCTLLNKTWEKEARKKLLRNVLLDLSSPSVKKEFAQNLACYTEAMQTRGAYHSKLRIGGIKSVHESNVLWYLMNRQLRETWPFFPGKWTNYFLEMLESGMNGPKGPKWFSDVKSPPAGYFDEQDRFLVFSELIGLHVKELSVIWPSPKDVTYFTEVLSKFTKLTQLELVITVPMDKEDFEDVNFSPIDPRLASLTTKFPAGFVLSSVQRLMIKFDYDSHSELVHFFIKENVEDLAGSILELCPNMECLHLDGFGKIFGQEIGRDASRFAKLREVNFDLVDDHQVGILSLPCPLRVIHVHFGMANGLQGLQEIFSKFSNTLEDFKMGVDMVPWETLEPQAGRLALKRSTIFIPKMPKLKKIHISVAMTFTPLGIVSTAEQREKLLRSPCRPAYDFVFETATGNQKIDYDSQFPCLTTIVIKSGCRFTIDGPRKHNVLHDFFIPQIQPPCTTVRFLDIDYPAEDKEFLDRNSDCATGCDCWIWKNDITQLYKRMAETFPNVMDERFTPFRK
ncbi:uncharacterized protein LOC118434091 [Folsomia candida]|uniref:F-box domain-containing protein n=1 Tax=Folsomia candida TaxID=158441 RepID=A0A226F413_FOLCA|nr:uncharacterized protein LOC118434091 [Folsomia candida]XP_035702767.1 uncharacterized protein LOC118434091 [Folsomia candida]OXA64513.1 hypothetical protein Fcan01_00939 [Folsomia candida]